MSENQSPPNTILAREVPVGNLFAVMAGIGGGTILFKVAQTPDHTVVGSELGSGNVYYVLPNTPCQILYVLPPDMLAKVAITAKAIETIGTWRGLNVQPAAQTVQAAAEITHWLEWLTQAQPQGSTSE